MGYEYTLTIKSSQISRTSPRISGSRCWGSWTSGRPHGHLGLGPMGTGGKNHGKTMVKPEEDQILEMVGN